MSADDIPGWIGYVTERAAVVHKHLQSPDVEQYRNKPWAVIEAIDAFAQKNQIPMLITRAKMEVVRDLLADMHPKPKVIVEFGAYVGSSAVAWGAILRDLHGADAEGLRVYAFELDAQIADCARDMVELAGLADVATVLEGSGSESLTKLHDDGKLRPGEVDMVFIDHWEKYYVPDLQLCERLKLFHVGSLALADNVDFPGAPTYQKYVESGGSGSPGAVQYETSSVKVDKEERQSIVMVSKVVQA